MSLHNRNLQDYDKQVSVALPAAAASVNTPPIDLEQETGGLIDELAFRVEVPALPNLAADKNVTIVVMDSADGAAFAPTDPMISTTVTGASGGGAAKSVEFRLPPTARRYVALNIAVDAAGGNNTAAAVTLSALF